MRCVDASCNAFCNPVGSMHRRNNIAGLVSIACVGVESINLDGTINGHHTYCQEI